MKVNFYERLIQYILPNEMSHTFCLLFLSSLGFLYASISISSPFESFLVWLVVLFTILCWVVVVCGQCCYVQSTLSTLEWDTYPLERNWSVDLLSLMAFVFFRKIIIWIRFVSTKRQANPASRISVQLKNSWISSCALTRFHGLRKTCCVRKKSANSTLVLLAVLCLWTAIQRTPNCRRIWCLGGEDIVNLGQFVTNGNVGKGEGIYSISRLLFPHFDWSCVDWRLLMWSYCTQTCITTSY